MREALAESQRRFAEPWPELSAAQSEHRWASYYGEETYALAKKVIEASRELVRLKNEAGLDAHRQ